MQCNLQVEYDAGDVENQSTGQCTPPHSDSAEWSLSLGLVVAWAVARKEKKKSSTDVMRGGEVGQVHTYYAVSKGAILETVQRAQSENG